jgi:hypothetical protein
MKGAGEGETGSHGHKDGVAGLGIGQHRRTEHFSTLCHKFEEVTLGMKHFTGLKQSVCYTFDVNDVTGMVLFTDNLLDIFSSLVLKKLLSVAEYCSLMTSLGPRRHWQNNERTASRDE